ncbi:MAG: hypothetical protein JNL96_13720 [Planctomycetaceae bacterium]|nr:hypothetical protein [Planctomycetaceae bacterium]
MPKDSFGDYDAESIRNLAARMGEFQTRFRALGEAWGAEKFGTLRIAKNDQRDRAIKFLTNFAAAVELAIDEARKQSGRFTVKAEDEKPVRSKKTKPS